MNEPTLYLDHAASTRPSERALACYCDVSRRCFANQEAVGELGRQARLTVEQAGRRLAGALVPGFGCVFLNTGTDALDAAVQAHFLCHPGSAAVTTKTEHPALLQALKRYAGEVRFCPVSRTGKAETGKLDLSGNVSLLAIHHVNAETGAVQSVSELRKKTASGIRLLLDATQSACRLPIPRETDLLVCSGVKFGSPGGSAVLFRPDRKFADALKRLRQQEHSFGRCLPAAAAAMAEEAAALMPSLETRFRQAENWKREALSLLAGTGITETVPESSPYILHLLVPGKQGAVLVRLLGSMGLSIAAGSACQSETPEPSAVLTGMGFRRDEAFSALRISLPPEPEQAPEAKVFANLLKTALKNY